MVFIIFLLERTSCTCFDRSGLKLIIHWKVKLFISLKSLLRSVAVVSGFLIAEDCNVLSANNFGP